MIKLSLISAIIVLMLSGLLAGCVPANRGEEASDEAAYDADFDIELQTPQSGVKEEHVTLGKILEFSHRGATVLTGDTVRDFDVINESGFFVGETAGVVLTDNGYELRKFLDRDTDVRCTTCGSPITSETGTVKSIDGLRIVIATDSGEYGFTTAKASEFETGAAVRVEYFDYEPGSEEKIFLALYDEITKLSLKITGLGRTDSGNMIISGADQSNNEYEVYVLSDTVLDFHYDTAALNDEIIVYHSEIELGTTTKVYAEMIQKTTK